MIRIEGVAVIAARLAAAERFKLKETHNKRRRMLVLRVGALGKAALATWSALNNTTVAKRGSLVSDGAAVIAA